MNVIATETGSLEAQITEADIKSAKEVTMAELILELYEKAHQWTSLDERD